MSWKDSKWVVMQIGRREHYSLARLLASDGRLQALYTDLWSRSPPSVLLPSFVRQRLQSRYHPEISNPLVHTPPAPAWFACELSSALQSRLHGGWKRTIGRNNWFQYHAVNWLENEAKTFKQPILFAYAYAAELPFKWAKRHGWATVLGQIDPGPRHYEIVNELAQIHKLPPPDLPPESYWRKWEMECQLADHIVVNSEWSRECLLANGINGSKLSIIPLTYDISGIKASNQKSLPETFTQERPLRILYAGKLASAKGMAELFDAAVHLQTAPVEWWLAGPCEEGWIRDRLIDLPAIRWLGDLPGGAMSDLYQRADVLLLPTHSDGFALVQLEALAHGLPVIASRNCGRLIQSGVQGELLSELCGSIIAQIIQNLLMNPLLLKHWAQNARVPDICRRDSVLHQFNILAAGLAKTNPM